jgi:hypothetical protein
MSLGLAIRLVIDSVMTVLLLSAMACRITGDAPHEWIGVAVFVLFVVHNAVNWRWYRGLFRGKYDFRRVFNTAVNMLLLVVIATLAISGVQLSRTIFAFAGFSGAMRVRQAHTVAAYWGLILIAVHIGTHWEMIMAAMLRMMGITKPNRARTMVLRAITALIFAYGVYASFDREMGAKLFLGYSFDFWDPDRPAAGFFTSTLAIMGVYVLATHYALKLLARRKKPTGRRQGASTD